MLAITLKTPREKWWIEEHRGCCERGIKMRESERKRVLEKLAHDFRVAIGLEDPIMPPIPAEFSRSGRGPHWTGD